MWRSMAKVAAATAVFGLLHSVLASRAAKQTAVAIIGERNRNGLYRVFFIGQSLLSFAILAAYIRRQPSRELYRVRGPAVLVLRAGQVVAILYATAAAQQVGIRRISGWQSLHAWCGEGQVPAEPEAQGPALDPESHALAGTPFQTSRHPLNLAPLLILWLWPRMTTNMLAFNTVTSCYLLLGSLHEESRLRSAYGDRYVAYQQSGVPFYFPTAPPLRRLPDAQLLAVDARRKNG